MKRFEKFKRHNTHVVDVPFAVLLAVNSGPHGVGFENYELPH